MGQESYPTDLIITVEDLIKSPWEELVSSVKEPDYPNYWISLSRAAQTFKSGEEATRKVLWLLADACSMMLKPEKYNTPFEAIAITGKRRTAIVDDFSESDLIFFEEILPHINDFRLLARIADILWIRKEPRSPDHALKAIEAYMAFPLDPETLFKDGKEAWHRAISLSKMLGRGTKNQISKIRKQLYSTFKKASIDDRLYALELSNLLINLDIERDKVEFIEKRLESYGDILVNESEFYSARLYFEEIKEWFKKNNNHDVFRIISKIAETFVSESESNVQPPNSSHMLAGHFFELAIKEYRKIPLVERPKFRADDRIREIHTKMNIENQLAEGEMAVISTPGIDIGELIEKSKKHVMNRTFPEVLLFFAHVSPISEIETVKNQALNTIKHGLLHSIIGSTHMANDGRVVARTSGINLKDENSQETQEAIWGKMIQTHGIQLSITVQALILPALGVINLEHRITEKQILSLCNHSAIIPPNREIFWAKGLLAGFERDFLCSTHLLVPQVEHFVRYQMKINNFETSTLDSKGIETENGLSKLLESKGIDSVLNPDIVFEFKALLTDSSGPNLRNETAHGLLENDFFYAPYPIYFWWLCLHLVIKSIPWKTPGKPDPGSKDEI